MSFARRRGSSRDQSVAAIASSRIRASARWPCFCQKRHIENARPIATGGSGSATARSRTARMSSCSSSRRSSQRRWSGPDSSPAAWAASATYQSRWRAWRRAVSPRAASCSAAYSRIVSRSRNRVSPPATSSGLIETLVEQGHHAVDDVAADLRRRTADRLRRREVEPAGEHRQPVEQPLGVRRRGCRSSRRSQRAASAGAVAGRARRRPAGRAGAPSRPRIASGDRSLIRAAASSMASGMPWSRAQMAATAGAFSLVTVKPGLTATARSMNRRTAAYCSIAAGSTMRDSPGMASRSSPLRWLGSGGAGRPGTGYSCSPETCRVARLVTTILIPGAVRSRSATIGAAETTCSKLSSTSSTVLSRSQSASVSAIGRAVPSDDPDGAERSWGRPASGRGSARAARRTRHPRSRPRRGRRAGATVASCPCRPARSA